MKFVHPDINALFDTDIPKVNTVVIENKKFYYSFINEMHDQINGTDGKFILSDNNTPVSISKHMEILFDFISLDINKKTLINKMISQLEKVSVDEEHYSETVNILGKIEKLMTDIAFQCSGDVVFSKLSVGSLIKTISPQFVNDYASVTEKILDYMQLVNEYEGKKLFLTVNLRSFVDDYEMNLFMKSVLMHGHNLIMLENYTYPYCEFEKRIIIDNDLCEIS